MISLSDAIETILKTRPERGMELVPLIGALGQICAEDVNATLTQPPFPASAMDGYAVNFGSGIKSGDTFKVIGEAPAGKPFDRAIRPGDCVRIYTGSVVPEGADHVIIQENVTRKDDEITVVEDQPIPRNIRRAGIDFKRGDTLIEAGIKITPAHIALAAAGNHAGINIRKPLHVALLASGDELVPPGSKVGAGQIVSSNQAGLTALIQSWGHRVTDLGIAEDKPADIKAHIARAGDADIIVPIGGASVGDHDHMREVFAELDYELTFEKVAVRPGKPTWFAQKGKQFVLGLPGNPASAYVCAHIFLKRLLGSADDIETISLPVTEAIPANGDRDHFQRSEIIRNRNTLSVTPFQATDSSLITPLAQSNGLIHLKAGTGPWKAGDKIDVLPLFDDLP